jgi:hypothetical protein
LIATIAMTRPDLFRADKIDFSKAIPLSPPNGFLQGLIIIISTTLAYFNQLFKDFVVPRVGMLMDAIHYTAQNSILHWFVFAYYRLFLVTLFLGSVNCMMEYEHVGTALTFIYHCNFNLLNIIILFN